MPTRAGWDFEHTTAGDEEALGLSESTEVQAKVNDETLVVSETTEDSNTAQGAQGEATSAPRRPPVPVIPARRARSPAKSPAKKKKKKKTTTTTMKGQTTIGSFFAKAQVSPLHSPCSLSLIAD